MFWFGILNCVNNCVWGICWFWDIENWVLILWDDYYFVVCFLWCVERG